MDNNNNLNTSDEKMSPDDLYNLIQDIQSKLNNESNEKCDTDTKEKEIGNKKIENNNTNNFDFLQNINLSGLLNMFTSNKETNGNKKELNNLNIDPNMVLKLQRVISSINKEDPRKDLLLSLKPFLRKSRQDKLNEYLNIMTILKAISEFSDKEGSDNDV